MISKKHTIFFYLGLIFIMAVAIRFIYFPDNVYFGFDQARDAFASQEIFKGNFKIVGPPSSSPYFHHGVLYYYIFGSIYQIFGGNPEAVSAFLRIINALGVILIFLIAKTLFKPTVGIIAGILFAFSYEQTQFSLFLNHPPLVIISLLIFYLGLAKWIFNNKIYGFFLALLGLGLSLQFEFVEIQLIPVFLMFLIYFRKLLPPLNFKNFIFAVLSFGLPVSTFIAAEVKNNFTSLRSLYLIIFQRVPGGEGVMGSDTSDFLFIAHRFFTDNFIFYPPLAAILAFTFLIFISIFIKNKEYQNQMIFLGIWFFGGFLIYFFTKNDAYFYNTGTSISLLIFAAFLLYQLYQKNKIIVFVIMMILIISNLYLISQNNPTGPNNKINPQKGLVLSDEKKIIDFIYQKAEGQKFAVNALTMPLNINTTWSYLFEWYGQKKYGYLPIWGGDAAEGYYGGLKVIKARSSLPQKRFLILEPKDAIYPYLIDNFLAEEAIFTDVIEKKNIGTMEVWVQKPK